MIGRIRGTLIEKHLTEILVDVNGIGYEISVPMSTLYRLPESGQGLVLHTHLAVREDAQTLYGFLEMAEKKLFRALIRVSGVGPKLALAILSGMAVDEFVRTVNANDVAAMVRMPGVGKKTAERLIIEMRDRLAEWGPTSSPETGDGFPCRRQSRADCRRGGNRADKPGLQTCRGRAQYCPGPEGKR